MRRNPPLPYDVRRQQAEIEQQFNDMQVNPRLMRNPQRGADGQAVELIVADGQVQYRVIGTTTWIPICPLESLRGPAGAAGSPGSNGTNGVDGKSVELQTTTTHIQWRQTGGSWANLVALADLKGAKGDTGSAGSTGPAGPSAKVTLGTITMAQTAAIAIAAGDRVLTFTVTGAIAGEDLLLFPTSALPAGYFIKSVIATAANTVAVTLNAPLLAIGASYSIPAKVVALR